DGIETAVHLWEQDSDIQIVLCTAHSDYSWQDVRQRLQRTDQLIILKKPFDNIEILQLASALTARWNLTQVVRRRLQNLETLLEHRTTELESAHALLIGRGRP